MKASKHDNNERSHFFKESVPSRSSRIDLSRGARVLHSHIHEVVLMIEPRNMAELTRILENVSDPTSSSYGQHLTKDDVDRFTSNFVGRDAVVEYLKLKGASVISETLNGEYVTATAPISVWDYMFDTEFYVFHQTQVDGKTRSIVRAESYSIPMELRTHVRHVLNTIQMPLVTRSGTAGSRITKKSTKSSNGFHLTSDYGNVSPRKIKAFYNASGFEGSSLSTQAVYASGGQNFSPIDLRTFQVATGLLIESAETINGFADHRECLRDSSICSESNLDVQYLMATSQGSPTTHWYQPGDFTDWLIAGNAA